MEISRCAVDFATPSSAAASAYPEHAVPLQHQQQLEQWWSTDCTG